MPIGTVLLIIFFNFSTKEDKLKRISSLLFKIRFMSTFILKEGIRKPVTSVKDRLLT